MTNKTSLPSFSKSLFSGYVLEELVFPYPVPEKEESEHGNVAIVKSEKLKLISVGITLI